MSMPTIITRCRGSCIIYLFNANAVYRRRRPLMSSTAADGGTRPGSGRVRAGTPRAALGRYWTRYRVQVLLAGERMKSEFRLLPAVEFAPSPDGNANASLAIAAPLDVGAKKEGLTTFVVSPYASTVPKRGLEPPLDCSN
jgi:hypothetical protein